MAALVKSFVLEARMRGVVPRRLKIVFPLAASITNAPELEPAPAIARLRLVFREAADAVPATGDRIAAKTAIGRSRRAIGGLQQGRRARVSVNPPLAGRLVRCDTRPQPWARSSS